MYADDLDWSWRVRLAGYDIGVECRSIIHHKWRGSGLNLERMLYYLERNQLRVLLKNYALVTLLLLAPPLFVVKLLRVCWLTLRARHLVTSTLRAWCWNLENLRDTLRERRKIQSARTVRDSAIIAAMLFGSIELRLGLGIMRHPILSEVRSQGDSDWKSR
jgi:GT2 family glycosyltransferase